MGVSIFIQHNTEATHRVHLVSTIRVFWSPGVQLVAVRMSDVLTASYVNCSAHISSPHLPCLHVACSGYVSSDSRKRRDELFHRLMETGQVGNVIFLGGIGNHIFIYFCSQTYYNRGI